MNRDRRNRGPQFHRRAGLLAVVLAFLSIAGVAAARTLTLSDDDNSLRDNTVVNGTTARYRYLELLNGWFGQAYLQTSGGYGDRILDAGRKVGLSFTPPYNMPVKRVLLYVDGDSKPTPDQIWKVSLQTTNPETELPSGVELGSVVQNGMEGLPCTGDCGAIQGWDLLEPVTVARGTRYWIVVEFVSGTPPSGVQTLFLVTNMVVTPEGMTPEQNYTIRSWNLTNSIPISNVWGVEDYSWRDPTFRLCLFANGAWNACEPASIGVMAVESVDGDVYGSVHRHQYTGLGLGTEVIAEQFVVHEQDVTVNQLVLAVGNRFPSSAGKLEAAVDLNVEIWEGDAIENTPASHRTIHTIAPFIDRTRFDVGHSALVPYSQAIDPPLTLKKGKTYMVVVSAPGISSTCQEGQPTACYTLDMAGPRGADYHAEDPWYGARLTYQGTAARNFAAASTTSSSWTNQGSSSRHKHDLPVPMKLVDRFAGEFTTVSLDAGNEVWKEASFDFEIQQGTSLKAQLRVSADNETWSEWRNVNDGAELSSSTPFPVPTQYRKRYIKIKGLLFTNDPQYTPLLHSLTLLSERFDCGWCSPDQSCVGGACVSRDGGADSDRSSEPGEEPGASDSDAGDTDGAAIAGGCGCDGRERPLGWSFPAFLGLFGLAAARPRRRI